MKQFEFKIDRIQARWIFERAIRSKIDVIDLWMQTIKVMILNIPLEESQVMGSIVLQVSKMSRLFYIKGDGTKIFSVYFPFSVEYKDNFRFYTSDYNDIDSEITSDILGLIGNKKITESSDIFDFAEPLSDVCGMEPELWNLFRYLMLSEDGYIRYDFDQKRVDGQKHPLHHLDIFYSSGSTFKLGLEKQLPHKELLDMLDLTSDCYYLTRKDK